MSPSLGLRVTAEIKRKLDDAAERSGRSQSQEAELRIDQSFGWERIFGDMDKARADHDRMLADEFENALTKKGFQRITMSTGILWAEPGMDYRQFTIIPQARELTDALGPMLEEKIEQLMKKAGRS